MRPAWAHTQSCPCWVPLGSSQPLWASLSPSVKWAQQHRPQWVVESMKPAWEGPSHAWRPISTQSTTVALLVKRRKYRPVFGPRVGS